VQDRYAGDIGDYIKLSLLRTLGQDRALGVAWWLTPNEEGNEDGRYTVYLDRMGDWRRFDSQVFDTLGAVTRGNRSVRALQATGLLSARYADERLDSRAARRGARGEQRNAWFKRVLSTVAECDLVFVDPDNGIEPDGFDVEAPRSNKSVTLHELCALGRDGRTLLVYHHQTRRAGGHLQEIGYLHQRLRGCLDLQPNGALRARPWSARLFLLINGSKAEEETMKKFASRLHPHCTWHAADSLDSR
jgi:hypothetical protein